MRILALETVDQSGSVAALTGDRIVAQRDLDPQVRSAQSLAPTIAEVLENARWNPREIELVAVAVGPGSFTGLRVGVTTAKMLAYAVGSQVLGVNALEAVAWQVPEGIDQICVVVDAQREQLFAAHFRRDFASVWQWQEPAVLVDAQSWLAGLSAAEAISGPGLAKLANRLPGSVHVLERALWSPRAVTVGRLAWQQYQSGRRDDVFTLVPQYFRPSAAEEKRQQAK